MLLIWSRAGVHGGHVVSAGVPEEIMKNHKSITGKYLSGELRIEVPQERRKPCGFITIIGAKENNLKNLTGQSSFGSIMWNCRCFRVRKEHTDESDCYACAKGDVR